MYCHASDIFLMSVLSNLSLFRMVHFQRFHNETGVNNRVASWVPTILKQKSLITNISELTDMYDVFPGSTSQEENWTDSVHNHDNEHRHANTEQTKIGRTYV